MLNILCNMALLHGYSMVSRWFGAGLESTTPNDELLQVFAEYIDSLVKVYFPADLVFILQSFNFISWFKFHNWRVFQDPDTSFTACECLCKIFLKEANVAWTGVLSRLLLKAFDPATNNIPKLKACLVTFIPVFAEWSRWVLIACLNFLYWEVSFIWNWHFVICHLDTWRDYISQWLSDLVPYLTWWT